MGLLMLVPYQSLEWRIFFKFSGIGDLRSGLGRSRESVGAKLWGWFPFLGRRGRDREAPASYWTYPSDFNL